MGTSIVVKIYEGLLLGLMGVSFVWAQDKEVVLPTPGSTVHHMVLVPAGEFTMGALEGSPDAQPVREVYLDTYYIDKYEVSNAHYQNFVRRTGRKQPSYAGNKNLNAARQSVAGVTWEDARAYCAWTGLKLPTEAEWEKAARGIDAREFPWGNEPPTGIRANFADINAELAWRDTLENDGYAYSSPVDAFAAGASPYDAYDLAGNLWEWVADWYASDYYVTGPKRNPPGPEEGTQRVVRGGSWYHGPLALQSSFRNRHDPSHGTLYIGFRCAQTAEKVAAAALPMKTWGRLKRQWRDGAPFIETNSRSDGLE